MDATDLAYAGAAEQARLVRDGEVSAREVVEATLERIERLDPRLNAYRVVFAERALAEADQADARHAAGQERPLLGVPVAIKDDAHIAGEVTAWGGSANGGPRPVDSDVVARLRAAGAIFVGKTNVPELTIWPFTETVAFGASRNPWNTRADPRRVQRRLGRRRRGRPLRRRARPPTAPARSAFRRRSAACSGSSPSATASRSAPTTTTPGTGSSSPGRSRGTSPTRRCSSTRPPTAGPRAATPRALAEPLGRAAHRDLHEGAAADRRA